MNDPDSLPPLTLRDFQRAEKDPEYRAFLTSQYGLGDFDLPPLKADTTGAGRSFGSGEGDPSDPYSAFGKANRARYADARETEGGTLEKLGRGAIIAGSALNPFQDEIAGVVGGMAGAMRPGGNLASAKEGYVEARDAARAPEQAFRAENPKLSAALNIAGGVVSPLNKLMPGGGAGRLARETRLGRAVQSAGQGAVGGATFGFGAAEGSAGDQAFQTTLGGVLGAGLGAVAGAVRDPQRGNQGQAMNYLTRLTRKEGRNPNTVADAADPALTRRENLGRPGQSAALDVAIEGGEGGERVVGAAQGRIDAIEASGRGIDDAARAADQAAATRRQSAMDATRTFERGAMQSERAAQPGRVERASHAALQRVTGLLGRRVTVDVEKALAAEARKITEPLYRGIRKAPVRLSEGFKELIDPTVETAFTKGTTRYNLGRPASERLPTSLRDGKGNLLDVVPLGALDELKKGFDEMGGDITDKGAQRAFRARAEDMAQAVRDLADPQVAGYKPAREAAQGFIKHREGIMLGRGLLGPSARKTARGDVSIKGVGSDELAAQLPTMTPMDRGWAVAGLADDIVRRSERQGPAAALNALRGAMDRVEMLVGKVKADEMRTLLAQAANDPAAQLRGAVEGIRSQGLQRRNAIRARETADAERRFVDTRTQRDALPTKSLEDAKQIVSAGKAKPARLPESGVVRALVSSLLGLFRSTGKDVSNEMLARANQFTPEARKLLADYLESTGGLEGLKAFQADAARVRGTAGRVGSGVGSLPGEILR